MDDRDSWMKRHINTHRLQFINNLNTDLFIAGFTQLHEMIRNRAFHVHRYDGDFHANTLLIDSIVKLDDFPDSFIKFCEKHNINADLVRIVRTGLQEYEDRQNHLRRRNEQHRERTNPLLVPRNGDQDRASPDNHSPLGPLRLVSNNINEHTNGELVSQEGREEIIGYVQGENAACLVNLECTISGLKGADDNVGAKLPDATLETPCPCPHHANVNTSSSSSSSSDSENMPRSDNELDTSSDTNMQIDEHVLPSSTKKIGHLPSERSAPLFDPSIDRRDQNIASTHNHIFILPKKLTDLCQDKKDNVNQTNLITASSNRNESKNGGSVSLESMGEITGDIISMENAAYLVNPLECTINGFKDADSNTEMNCSDETEMSCPCPYHTHVDSVEDNNFSENNARRNNFDEKNARRKYGQELKASSSSSHTTNMSSIENELDTFTTDTNMQSGEPVTSSFTMKIGNLPLESTASVYNPNIDRGDFEQKTSRGDKASFVAEHVASSDVNVSNDTKCLAREINSARNNSHLKNNTAKDNSADNQFQERLVSKENTLLENVSPNNARQNVSNNSQTENTLESWESYYLSSSDEEELIPNTAIFEIDSLKEFSKRSSDLEKPVQTFHSSEVTGDNFQRVGPSEIEGDTFHREGHSEISTAAGDTSQREGQSETSTVTDDTIHREGHSETSTVTDDTIHREEPSKVKFIVHSTGLSGVECQEDLDKFKTKTQTQTGVENSVYSDENKKHGEAILDNNHLKASNSRISDHSNTLVKTVDCEDGRDKQKSVTYSNSITERKVSPLSLTESMSSETDVKEVNEITKAVPQQQACEEKQIQYDSDDFHSLHITTQISNIKESIEDMRNLDRSNSVPLSANSFATSACSGSSEGFNLPALAFDALEVAHSDVSNINRPSDHASEDIQYLVREVHILEMSNTEMVSTSTDTLSAENDSLITHAYSDGQQLPITSFQTIEEDNSICTLSCQNDGSDHTISFSELNQHSSENNSLEGIRNNNSTQSNITIQNINVVLTQTARIIEIYFPELCFRF